MDSPNILILELIEKEKLSVSEALELLAALTKDEVKSSVSEVDEILVQVFV